MLLIMIEKRESGTFLFNFFKVYHSFLHLEITLSFVKLRYTMRYATIIVMLL